MCCDHLAVILLFTGAGPVSQQTGQVDLHGPVCSTLWKIQECLFPRILTPKSSKCSTTSMWGGLVLPICVFCEFINVVYLLLWISAACKQVAKYQQDQFSPPPVPTPKPYRTGQGQQQSKQMFYICCAFWVAVLIFPPCLLPQLCCYKNKLLFFSPFPCAVCLIARQTTVWLFHTF